MKLEYCFGKTVAPWDEEEFRYVPDDDALWDVTCDYLKLIYGNDLLSGDLLNDFPEIENKIHESENFIAYATDRFESDAYNEYMGWNGPDADKEE